MNFRSVQDIKKMHESKLVKNLKVTGPKSKYRPDFEGLKQSFQQREKPIRESEAPGDREHLARKLAEAKQKISLGKIRAAILILEDLKEEPFRHSDVFYLLGECFRRTGSSG